MEFFAKIIEGWKPLIIFEKKSILDVWQGSEYVWVEMYCPVKIHLCLC